MSTANSCHTTWNRDRMASLNILQVITDMVKFGTRPNHLCSKKQKTVNTGRPGNACSTCNVAPKAQNDTRFSSDHNIELDLDPIYAM